MEKCPHQVLAATLTLPQPGGGGADYAHPIHQVLKAKGAPDLGVIGYHSEPSDVCYSQNQFLGWDFF